jgi:putative DNA primase/helicase
MSAHENYQQVLHQMEQFGIEFAAKDLPLEIDRPKRRTCGKKGKAWYWLQTFRTSGGAAYIVGRFGSYKSGESEKVEVDWKPLSDAERERLATERAAARERQAEARREEGRLAAMSAAELWRTAARQGTSDYLRRKCVEAEACRFLPDGSIVVPLLRYDWPRERALVATQRIYPAPRFHRVTGDELPQKTFTKGFEKPGASLRLGEVVEGLPILVAEGYSTALSIRMAVGRALPVFMALDAGNLEPVCALIRQLHPAHRVLICADDDWKTLDHDRKPWNAGRVKAKAAAKAIDRCDVVYPSFVGLPRGEKDTDFNDLHVLGGLGRVQVQLDSVLDAIRRHRPAAATR